MSTDRKAIVAFMQDNPEMTLDEIGAFYDLTRERIRQIAKQEGYKHPWHHGRGGHPPAVPKACVVCRAPTVHMRSGWTLYCADHKGWTRRSGVPLPPVTPTTHTCTTCGLVFERKEYRRQPTAKPNPFRTKPQTTWFCDYTCKGVWVAEHHGYGYRPKPILVCQHCGTRFTRHGNRAATGIFCDILCMYAWMKANGSLKAHGKFTPIIVDYDDLRKRVPA